MNLNFNNTDVTRVEKAVLEVALSYTKDDALKQQLVKRIADLAKQIPSETEMESKSASQAVRKYGDFTSEQLRDRFSDLKWLKQVIKASNKEAEKAEAEYQMIFSIVSEMFRMMNSANSQQQHKVIFTIPTKQGNEFYLYSSKLKDWVCVYNRDLSKNLMVLFKEHFKMSLTSLEGEAGKDKDKYLLIWNRINPILKWWQNEGQQMIEDSPLNYGESFAEWLDVKQYRCIQFEIQADRK